MASMAKEVIYQAGTFWDPADLLQGRWADHQDDFGIGERVGGDLGTGRPVLVVGESGTFAGPGLHPQAMTLFDESQCHLGGDGDATLFLWFSGNGETHVATGYGNPLPRARRRCGWPCDPIDSPW
jgi:hypothetical protein